MTACQSGFVDRNAQTANQYTNFQFNYIHPFLDRPANGKGQLEFWAAGGWVDCLLSMEALGLTAFVPATTAVGFDSYPDFLAVLKRLLEYLVTLQSSGKWFLLSALVGNVAGCGGIAFHIGGQVVTHFALERTVGFVPKEAAGEKHRIFCQACCPAVFAAHAAGGYSALRASVALGCGVLYAQISISSASTLPTRASLSLSQNARSRLAFVSC